MLERRITSAEARHLFIRTRVHRREPIVARHPARHGCQLDRAAWGNPHLLLVTAAHHDADPDRGRAHEHQGNYRDGDLEAGGCPRRGSTIRAGNGRGRFNVRSHDSLSF
jgi:hypothetical protein